MTRQKSEMFVVALVGVIMVLMGCIDQPGQETGRLSEIGQALPKAAGPWKVALPLASYSPETLFEYINGHAEVYIAYGLRASIAQRYQGPEGMDDIVVDVFEMATPADAFGVFTHDQDGEEVPIGQGALFRYGWLSFWKGPFFVSIYAEGESDQARQAVLELGQEISAAINEEGPLPSIVLQLPRPGLVPRSVRYLHHPNILAAHLSLSPENILRLGTEAVAVLGRYQRAGEKAHLLIVKYSDSATAIQASAAFRESFLEEKNASFQNPDGWYAMRRLSGNAEVLAFALRAESQEFAETVLSEAESVAIGGSQ